MHIDKTHLMTGFWLGLGLLLAYFIWSLLTGAAGRALSAARGGKRGN